MAWNGSDRVKTQANPYHGSDRAVSENKDAADGFQKSRALKYGLLLIASILAVGAAVWLFVCNSEHEMPTDPSRGKTARISEVKPHISTNKVDDIPKEPKKLSEMTREEKLKYYRDKYGDNIPANLKPVVYYLENPPQKTFEPNKPKYGYFKHESERTLAAVLKVKPGSLLIRQPKFGERFDADFQSAAIEKIEIKDDDPAEVRELKLAVQETKDELVRRVKAGEKASDILNAEGKALFDLGMYRQDIKKEIDKLALDPKQSDDDICDFITAANAMLQQKGAMPLRSSTLLYRQTALAISAERRKNAEKQK